MAAEKRNPPAPAGHPLLGKGGKEYGGRQVAAPTGKGGKRGEITVVGFLIRKDGSTVPMDEIMPEEREEWLESCRRRLTQRMSDWFAQHPEELAKL